jgi:hypothetical protein
MKGKISALIDIKSFFHIVNFLKCHTSVNLIDLVASIIRNQRHRVTNDKTLTYIVVCLLKLLANCFLYVFSDKTSYTYIPLIYKYRRLK